MDEVDGLCAVMDEEVRVCEALAGVLRDEQEAMVGLRPQAILACLERHRLLQDELGRLSARRRELLGQVAQARGAENASAVAVLPLLPPDPRARVQARLRRLRRALLEARSLERQNARVAGAGLDTVSEILAALRAFVPGARYGADAQLAPAGAAEAVDRRVQEPIRAVMAATANDPGAASGVLAPPSCGVPSGTPPRSSLRFPLSLPGSFASLAMTTRTGS